jgi:hypothetical protein
MGAMPQNRLTEKTLQFCTDNDPKHPNSVDPNPPILVTQRLLQPVLLDRQRIENAARHTLSYVAKIAILDSQTV